MNVLISGSHGMVGTRLISHLQSQGHGTVRLVRRDPQGDDILWNPSSGDIDKKRLEGLDAVVHLAGENIASGRWTAAKKEQIRKSRVEGTQLLCKALAELRNPPATLISASAIGLYGNRADEVLTEESSPGSGFLAEVCKEWEAATAAANAKNIRVVNLRIGVVLTNEGGALKKMLPPFQMGAGGKLGSGKQFMSWISLEDLIGAIHHVLTHEELRGPVNAVAPHAVTNNQLTAALGTVLSKPTIFPVPEFAAHLLLGEMADELLLSSALVRPVKLRASGYKFKHELLEPFLQQILSAA